MTDVNEIQPALITMQVEIPATQSRDAVYADVVCRMPVAELGRALQLDGPTLPAQVEALQHSLAEQLADPSVVTTCSWGCHPAA